MKGKDRLGHAGVVFLSLGFSLKKRRPDLSERPIAFSLLQMNPHAAVSTC
jgi:hypothetical protein